MKGGEVEVKVYGEEPKSNEWLDGDTYGRRVSRGSEEVKKGTTKGELGII